MVTEKVIPSSNRTESQQDQQQNSGKANRQAQNATPTRLSVAMDNKCQLEESIMGVWQHRDKPMNLVDKDSAT